MDMVTDWAIFFGHFHPLLVHLPIGLLLFAFLLALIKKKQEDAPGYDRAICLSVLTGFLTAVASCVLGWSLSLNGEYEGQAFSRHQFTGIATAVSAGLWYAWIQYAPGWPKSALRFRWVLPSVTLLLMGYAGHQGGNLTHGEDFLFSQFPLAAKINSASSVLQKPEKVPVDQAIAYTHLVKPVLEARCWNCHNQDKAKGGLRMHTPELLKKGGKHGAVIIAGNDAGSELVKRLLLPEGDEKRMPPKGKPELKAEEIELIKWWIREGADFEKPVKAYKLDSEISRIVESKLGGATPGQDKARADTVLAVSDFPGLPQKEIQAADKKLLQQLQERNLLVYPVKKGSPYLEISAINAPQWQDADLKLLAAIKENIVSLKLDNTRITDEGLAMLGDFSNLQYLSLRGNAITSKGISRVLQLPYLYYLNVTETRVDQQGVEMVRKKGTVKRFYYWKSNPSDDAK